MKHRSGLPRYVGLLLVTLLLVGWSVTPSPPTATPAPPRLTATPTTPAGTVATVTPLPPGSELNFVIMGDVLLYDSAARWAAQLEHDLRAKIVVHEFVTGGHATTTLLRRLRVDESLRAAIQNADVVFFDVEFAPFAFALSTYVSSARSDCGGVDSEECLREALTDYQRAADALFAEIIALRNPSDALIRTMDIYQYNVREQKAAGAFEVVNKYWRQANEHVAVVAAQYQIPVVPVYAAFMGTDGTGDPRDMGLVESDGVRPSEKGIELMVQLFAELGYARAPKP